MCYSGCPHEKHSGHPDSWGECRLRRGPIPEDAHCYPHDEVELEGLTDLRDAELTGA